MTRRQPLLFISQEIYISPFHLRGAASRLDRLQRDTWALLLWPTWHQAVDPIRTLLVLNERGYSGISCQPHLPELPRYWKIHRYILGMPIKLRISVVDYLFCFIYILQYVLLIIVKGGGGRLWSQRFPKKWCFPIKVDFRPNLRRKIVFKFF